MNALKPFPDVATPHPDSPRDHCLGDYLREQNNNETTISFSSEISESEPLDGNTTLHIAVQNGDFEKVKEIIGGGFEKLYGCNNHFETPLDLAFLLGHDQIAIYLIDPKKYRPRDFIDAIDEDFEGKYYVGFEQAYYESDDPILQLFYLEKLFHHCLQKKNLLKAALILNSAYEAAHNYQLELNYQERLLNKIERIEAKFYHGLVGSIESDYNGYLRAHRERLKMIRTSARLMLFQQQPIESIQEFISQNFSYLLKHIIDESIAILGEPPSEYAILGLGSLSRQEMSPYSDVEFAILIPNIEQKDYFIKLAHFIELKVTNIGETRFDIIRFRKSSEKKTSASSFCISGFSLDIGGLSPLGKNGIYELIGTPQDLAHYQSKEWLFFNNSEIIMANAMASASLLEGSSLKLFDEYLSLVKHELNREIPTTSSESEKFRHLRARELLQGHIHEFGPQIEEDKINLRAFNVKKEFYRPFQMILETLCLYFEIDKRKTIDKISDLRKQGHFSHKGAENLKRAFKIAITLRLKAQFFYSAEDENMVYIEKEEDKKYCPIGEEEKELIIEIYRILIPFHKAAVSFAEGNVKAFKGLSFYNDLIGAGGGNAEIEFQLKQAEAQWSETVALDPNTENLAQLAKTKLTLGGISKGLEYQNRTHRKLIEIHGERPNKEMATSLMMLGLFHCSLTQFHEGINYYKKSIEMQRILCNNEANRDLALCLIRLAFAYKDLDDETHAVSFLKEALELLQTIFKNRPHHEVATAWESLGRIYKKFNKCKDAITCFEKAMEIAKKIYGKKPNLTIAGILNDLGEIQQVLQNHKEAMNYFQECSNMQEMVFSKVSWTSPVSAIPLENIGESYLALNQFKQAKEYFERALEKKKLSVGDIPHPLIAISWSKLASVYEKENDTQEAIRLYEISLKIFQEYYGNNPHPDIAVCLIKMAFLYQSEKTFDLLLEALKIRRAVFGPQPHGAIIHSLYSLGLACWALDKHREGVNFLEEALVMGRVVHLEKSNDVIISILNTLIEVCKNVDEQKAEQYSKELRDCSESYA